MSTGTNVPATVPQTVNAKLSTWVHRPDVFDQIAAAVKGIMDPETFIAHAMVSFQQPGSYKGNEYKPGPRDCSPASQLKCLYEMAALGLLQTMGQVALIVRKGGEDGPQLTVMPQWQGYKAVFERNPAILEVQPKLVHVTDHFKWDAETETMEHSFDPFNPTRIIDKAETIRGGYLKIIYRDGRPPKYHFTSVADIEKRRRCAQKQEIWTGWYAEMCLKTVLRDAWGRRVIPVDTLAAVHLEKITAADDALLGNDPARPLVLEGHAEPEQPPKPKSRVEQMAADLKPPPSSKPVGIADHVGPVDQTDPMDEPPPFVPDKEAIDTESQSVADDQSADVPPEAEKQQVNAADALAEWSTAIGSLTTAASCQEFREQVMPTVPEAIQGKALAALLTRQIALEISIVTLARIARDHPDLKPLADKRQDTIRKNRNTN